MFSVHKNKLVSMLRVEGIPVALWVDGGKVYPIVDHLGSVKCHV